MSSIKTLRTKIFQRDIAPAFFLVFNTFVWYLLTYYVFFNTISEEAFKNQRLLLFAIYFLGIAITAIIGSRVSSRARDKLLNTWLFLGVLSTFLLTMLSANSELLNLIIVSFLGASIGLGLPSCLSYFAEAISIEKRGLIGGTIWSTVGFTVLGIGFLTSILGTLEAIILLTIWRLAGGVLFLFLNKTQPKIEAKKSPSYFALLRNKGILLYFLPWVMFSLINFAEAPFLQSFFGSDQYAFTQVAEYAFIGVFAFIGGFVADVWGRKRVIIAGFVMLGIEYATLSAFSNTVDSLFLSYIFLALDGVTWGLLFSVFLTVIWGDLGEIYQKDKLYALGGIPFLLAGFLSVLIIPSASVNLTTAFTIASFFLFVAVIPLMYAPETLPDKAIKDRDLQSYITKAKKIAEKEDGKKEKKDLDEKEKEEDSEESPENEAARKLAEKYY